MNDVKYFERNVNKIGRGAVVANIAKGATATASRQSQEFPAFEFIDGSDGRNTHMLKVERVACTKAGMTQLGTLHLTAHHLIFHYDGENQGEMWVPYPLISLVTRLPQTLQGQCPLTFHTRTFETFSLVLDSDSDTVDVFESVKELTVATSITQLYAFFYRPNPALPTNDGWSLYSPREEFGRMGVGTRSKAWRFTDINKDYAFCPTYPARLIVPTKISDTTLQYASRYRSKSRIPVLTYLHWANYGSLTRSSQPMVGLTQNRSIQDEKLIEAIFQSHYSPESRASTVPVYGATATNLIIDARPTTNAVANTAKGAGTENMDHYREGKKAYLGIDHIHTMRESLAKVVEALRDADSLLASINNDLSEQLSSLRVLDRQALRRSGWLRHICAILEGTLLITRNVHVNSSHVLIHCSDGWDRTSQLSAMSQLCLDPFYRTMRGFQILVEKDWLSYGHKFLDRCGHLSSEKFFLSPTEGTGTGSGADAAQAFLASVQNRFASQHHLKETSPIFHQFLESVRQVQRQFPKRFEFNERFLRQLYYHLYSCQFGTFLFNSEKDRKVGDGGPPPCERTISIWDFLNTATEMELNRNPEYDSSLDDPKSRAPDADMGVLLPNPRDVRFWHQLYGRTDEEMNGRVVSIPAQGAELVAPGDSAEEDSILLGSESSPAIQLPTSSSSKSLLVGGTKTPIISSSSECITTPSEETIPKQQSVWPLSAPSSAPSPRPPRKVSPSPSHSPGKLRTKPPELLSGAGLKSVWGRFSSNASTAFSVVQDAYVGFAKDLRSTLTEENDPSSKTAELKGREMLSSWGEETMSVSRSIEPLSLEAENPWARPEPAESSLTSLQQNPWGSVRSPSTKASLVDSPHQLGTPLPVDPNVAHPLPRAGASPSSAKTGADVDKEPMKPSTSGNSSDPLGVGFL